MAGLITYRSKVNGKIYKKKKYTSTRERFEMFFNRDNMLVELFNEAHYYYLINFFFLFLIY